MHVIAVRSTGQLQKRQLDYAGLSITPAPLPQFLIPASRNTFSLLEKLTDKTL